jgi:hypothetical protein
VRHAALALVGAVALPGVFALRSAPVPAAAGSAFAADLARFEAGDATLDARALRLPTGRGWAGPSEWDKAGEAWALLAKIPPAHWPWPMRSVIDPLSLNALTLQEEALQRLGRGADAQVRHRQILILLRAITGGTDGASRERAWNVVSAAEKDTALVLLGFLVTGEDRARRGPCLGHRHRHALPSGRGSTIWISSMASFGERLILSCREPKHDCHHPPRHAGDLPLIAQPDPRSGRLRKAARQSALRRGGAGRALVRPAPDGRSADRQNAGEAAGFALFFHNFSTFEGKPGIYLEDLYVRPEARGPDWARPCCSIWRGWRWSGAVRGWNGRCWTGMHLDRVLPSLGARMMNEWRIMRVDDDALLELGGAVRSGAQSG